MAKKFPSRKPIYLTVVCEGCRASKPISHFKKKPFKVEGPERDPLCKDCRKQEVKNSIRRRYF